MFTIIQPCLCRGTGKTGFFIFERRLAHYNMENQDKTKEQFIEEIESLRKEISELKQRLDFAERMNKVCAEGNSGLQS